MKILAQELLDTEETLDRFRQTRLKGFDQPLIYAGATLSLQKAVDPESLIPAQRYVLQEDLDFVIALHDYFIGLNIDIFALEGALMFYIEGEDGEPEGPIPLCPPLVEMSREEGGKVIPLINDGMHRVAAARALGKPINIIRADNVNPDYPYYALPLEKGWDEVSVLAELPDGFVKKAYRVPDNYKALFRDFNGVFPGIQKQRKKSNPESLKA